MVKSTAAGPQYPAPGVLADPAPSSRPVPMPAPMPVPRPAQGPSRPLTWGVSLGLAASGLTVAAQGLALVRGTQTIRAAVDALMPGRSGAAGALVDASVRAAYETLQARAVLSTGLAVAAGAMLVPVLRSGILSRISAVALMALNGLVLMVCVLDVFPQPARVVAACAIGLQPVAAALLFAPPAVPSRRTRPVPARHVGAPLIPVLTADGGAV